MTMQELVKTIHTFRITRYTVIDNGDGDYTLMFGDDDPMKEVDRLKMENAVLKTEIHTLASIAFKIPYEKAKEMTNDDYQIYSSRNSCGER